MLWLPLTLSLCRDTICVSGPHKRARAPQVRALQPFGFIPFGGGPRQCVGMRFALNEMRLCIAKTVHKYEFTLAPGFQIDYFTGNIFHSPLAPGFQ
ncbi:unnamed protein product, partial [Oppiella nova]